jgi:hypothetical protein
LTNFSGLNLDTTRVSDVGLTHLNGLTKLSTLFIPHTQVTDAGLEHLKGLSNLKLLTVSLKFLPEGDSAQPPVPVKRCPFAPNEPQLTAEGVWRLKQALPNLRVGCS